MTKDPWDNFLVAHKGFDWMIIMLTMIIEIYLKGYTTLIWILLTSMVFVYKVSQDYSVSVFQWLVCMLFCEKILHCLGITELFGPNRPKYYYVVEAYANIAITVCKYKKLFWIDLLFWEWLFFSLVRKLRKKRLILRGVYPFTAHFFIYYLFI